MPHIPRVQEIVLPLLAQYLPLKNTAWASDPGNLGSWVNHPNDRVYPVINVRRLGGLARDLRFLDLAVIELTVFGKVSLEDSEDLLLDAQEVLFDSMLLQRVVPGIGYIHSYRQTMGPTPFDSPYDDSWRIQSLIQIGLRPSRDT